MICICADGQAPMRVEAAEARCACSKGAIGACARVNRDGAAVELTFELHLRQHG